MSTLFHEGRIRFTDICEVIAAVLDEHQAHAGAVGVTDVGSALVPTDELDLSAVLAADRWARERAVELCDALPTR